MYFQSELKNLTPMTQYVPTSYKLHIYLYLSPFENSKHATESHIVTKEIETGKHSKYVQSTLTIRYHSYQYQYLKIYIHFVGFSFLYISIEG